MASTGTGFRPPRLPAGVLTATAMAVAGLVAVAEIDRLISGRLTDDLRSHSVGEFVGPMAWGQRDDWDDWLGLGDGARRDVAGWIVQSTAADIVFFLGYGFLLWQLSRATAVGRWTVRLLVGAEALEALLLLVASSLLADDRMPAWLRVVLAAVATVKWVLVAVVGVTLLRDDLLRRGLLDKLARASRALRVQRLSLVVVVVLAVLSLVPSPNLWDQFPDVIRGWSADSDSGVGHGYLASGLLLLTGAALFAVGRQRSERVWLTRVGSDTSGPAPPTGDPELLWWLGGPLVALAIAVGLQLSDRSYLVDWSVLPIFLGVPVAAVLLSEVVLLARRKRGLWSEQVETREPQRACDVWSAGDVLAVALLLVGALAVVRALLAPVVLQPAGGRSAVLALALAGAFGGPWLARWGIGCIDAAAERAVGGLPAAARTGGAPEPGLRAFLWPPHAGDPDGVLHRPVPLLIWASGLAALLLLVVRPVTVPGWLGVVGTALLALAGWSVVLGYLIVHLQYQQPLAVFRALHLRANPVLTLLLLAALLASLGGGVARMHDVRALPSGTSPASSRATDATEHFRSWLADGTGCEVALDGVPTRPLVLIAASGGGARAAMWSAGVVDLIAATGACGESAVFLSSGVSGGSVGLAVARGSEPGRAGASVADMVGPEALSAAVSGLLVGDLVTGSSGVLVPAPADGVGTRGDRAALMEEVWERQVPALAKAYGPEVAGPAGALVMNSTTSTGCRVLISQLDLGGALEEKEPSPLCSGSTQDLPATIDLQHLYDECFPRMTWATAAMLSARFPTVTPAGRISREADGCDGRPDLQLIDGGYAESSGLGTLADLAPTLLTPVLQHNSSRTEGEPVVLPVVLYLEDEPRTEIARTNGGVAPELVVPLVGQGAKGAQLSSRTLLQRVGQAYSQPCPVSGADACRTAARALDELLPDRVVVAAAATEAAVEAPLGWTLSPDSLRRLGDDLARLGPPTPWCRKPGEGAYGCLGVLLPLLGP
jgi:hypothetical protein